MQILRRNRPRKSRLHYLPIEDNQWLIHRWRGVKELLLRRAACAPAINNWGERGGMRVGLFNLAWSNWTCRHTARACGVGILQAAYISARSLVVAAMPMPRGLFKGQLLPPLSSAFSFSLDLPSRFPTLSPLSLPVQRYGCFLVADEQALYPTLRQEQSRHISLGFIFDGR